MTVLLIFAAIAGIFGIIGSIVPGLPGPPVSWLGMMLAFFAQDEGNETITLTRLIVWLLIMIVVSVMDYVLPAKLTKTTGGSKYAARGAIAGMIAGIFLTPIGMLLGSLLGAFLAEMFYADKDFAGSAKAAFGTFAGFMLGTGIKLIASGIMMYYITMSIVSSATQSSTSIFSAVLL